MTLEEAIKRLMKLNLENDQFAQVVLIFAEVFDDADTARALRIRENERARTARRRARSDVSEQEWYALRGLVFDRDGAKCAYCGNTDGPHQIDHVIPLSRGGRSVLENLVVACGPCNASKRDRLIDEWAGR